MKYKAVFVFVGLVFSLQAEHPQISLARTDFVNIHRAQSKIDSMLKWHFAYQVATVSCFVAGVGAIGYTAYRSANQKEVLVPVQIPISAETFNLFSEKFSKFMDIYIAEHNIKRNWIMSQLHWLKQTVSSQMLAIIGTVGASMVFNALNNTLGPISKYITRLDGLLDRTVSGIFHWNNLEWFITNHANLVGIFNALEQSAALIEGRQVTVQAPLLQELQEKVVIESVDEAQRREALNDFAAYWNIFIQQLESVLGFIHYKSLGHSNPLIGERMVSISNKIQRLVNDCAQSCQEKITQGEHDKIALYEDLKTLRAHIGLEISNFTLFESFKRFDSMNESKVNDVVAANTN